MSIPNGSSPTKFLLDTLSMEKAWRCPPPEAAMFAISNALTARFVAAILLTIQMQFCFAMSYTTISDRTLYQQSDLVLGGVIESRHPAASRPNDATEYILKIENRYKGLASAEKIVFEVMGSFDPEAEYALRVPGAPKIEIGSQLIIFLSRTPHGSLVPTQLGLGIFKLVNGNTGEKIATRDLSDLPLTGAGSKAIYQEYRNTDRFSAWLTKLKANDQQPEDYWTKAYPIPVPPQTFLVSNLPPARWLEFDSGSPVTFYAGTSGLNKSTSGGYAQFNQAINAWNQQTSAGLRLNDGGQSSAGLGLVAADGINQILFEDPYGEIPGSFACSDGGIAALTRWRMGPTSLLAGIAYRSIIEVDIVVQNGAGCLLESNAGDDMAELLTHELGHALGLGHSCGDTASGICLPNSEADKAIMRATSHGNGRGAQLGADDQAGIEYLYKSALNVPEQNGDGSNMAAATQAGGGAMSGLALCLLGIIHLLAIPASKTRRSCPLWSRGQTLTYVRAGLGVCETGGSSPARSVPLQRGSPSKKPFRRWIGTAVESATNY